MKTNVAVFLGCMSVEHEISIISAVQAMHSMDTNKYEIIPIYVTKQGEFLSGDVLKNIEEFKDLAALKEKCHPVSLVKANGRVLMKYLDNKMFKRQMDIEINVGFPIVHGTNCEDGTIQGYLEMLGLPYVGCDVLASALGMDKVIFKTVLTAADVPVLPCVSFTAREFSANHDTIINQIENQIGYPIIIKPANLGSSVGISKVENRAELGEAICLACSFAGKVLAERAVTALREINCSVLGDVDNCEASQLEEPIMTDKILSYDDKYRSGSKGKSSEGSKGMASLSRKLPADLPQSKAEEIKEIAKKAFVAMSGSGVCRIDFIMDTADNDKVYVNEANTIPGSLSFYLWEASGIKYTELLDRLIQLAFKRERNRDNIMFTMDSNILSTKSFGFKGSKN
ncbi:MAG: D-alanine--D-alanine ligase [Oscillospiraceae bacterium]|nr:D-alanine--D-alanine ligase [Oscillospiraceae bacterium]